MRLGYNNIHRLPHGYFGWKEANSSGEDQGETVQRLGVGDFFPSCQLVLLRSKRDRDYLKIQHNERTIALEDIDSEFIFIELYNELCQQCLEEVKNYKALHAMFNANDSLQANLRMMGIGVSSKKRQVAKFRKQQGIDFPLFADEKSGIFACLGKPTLPTSYLVQKHPNGGRKIILVQSGHIRSTEKLMERVRTIVTAEHSAVGKQPSVH